MLFTAPLQAKGDDKVDRALAQMMGGSLAGETVEGKLDQELSFPVHLALKEGEEHTEEQLKELKEWEGEKKKLDLEKETYTKALEAEGKKLKADIHEESNKFDVSLLELSSIRLRTDYKVPYLCSYYPIYVVITLSYVPYLCSYNPIYVVVRL